MQAELTLPGHHLPDQVGDRGAAESLLHGLLGLPELGLQQGLDVAPDLALAARRMRVADQDRPGLDRRVRVVQRDVAGDRSRFQPPPRPSVDPTSPASRRLPSTRRTSTGLLSRLSAISADVRVRSLQRASIVSAWMATALLLLMPMCHSWIVPPNLKPKLSQLQ
nr:hypothetical protein GCM10025732_31050 [Glycomyces mayteni]